MPNINHDARDYQKAEKAAWADSPAKSPYVGSAKLERERSTLDDVYGALGEANGLASRVKSLVDRLCGDSPESIGKGVDGEPFGIFPSLRVRSGDTLELVRQAQSALNRLDRELP